MKKEERERSMRIKQGAERELTRKTRAKGRKGKQGEGRKKSGKRERREEGHL